MKTLLVASVILFSLTICGCKEKPTTEELLLGYESLLNQVANYATATINEAEAQASRSEISDEDLAVQYQQITIIWARTIEEIDQEKQYRELWPLIFGADEPPSLAQSPANPDLLQWERYITQVDEYILIHYQMVDAAWKKLGYS